MNESIGISGVAILLLVVITFINIILCYHIHSMYWKYRGMVETDEKFFNRANKTLYRYTESIQEYMSLIEKQEEGTMEGLKNIRRILQKTGLTAVNMAKLKKAIDVLSSEGANINIAQDLDPKVAGPLDQSEESGCSGPKIKEKEPIQQKDVTNPPTTNKKTKWVVLGSIAILAMIIYFVNR